MFGDYFKEEKDKSDLYKFMQLFCPKLYHKNLRMSQEAKKSVESKTADSTMDKIEGR